MKLKYNDNAAALVWDIVNESEDIGNWVLTLEEEEIKGDGFKEFLNNAVFNNEMTNVVYVKNLKGFIYLLHNQISFKNIDFFGNDQKDFFYFKINDNIELRDWDKFEAKVDNGVEFIKRLNAMRDVFKCGNKNRLSLQSHFKTTKAHDMWEDIKYRYYLSSTWNLDYVKRLLPQTIEEYELMFNLNKSGFYYTNLNYSNEIVAGISSYDISSSHIGFMSRKKYPCSSFIKVEEDFQKVLSDKTKAWMGCFIFENLKYKIDLPINSGFWIERIYNEQGYITNDFCVCLTNVDIEWFKQVFEWDKVYVDELYECNMSYLPKEYINMVDSLYGMKNEQKKGTFGKEICKFRAELPFGQSIKKVEYDGELKYNEELDEFVVVETKKMEIDEVRKKLLKRKIPVQIGLWTVAYSRLELISLIIEIGIDNVIYADTDCVKFKGNKGIEIIERRNKEIDQEIRENKGNPYNLSEKLGRWEKEDVAAIKVIGIKWYLTINSKNEWEVKAAGAEIENLLPWIKNRGGFYAFHKQMKCPKLFKNIEAKGRTLVFKYISGFDSQRRDEMKKLCRQLIIMED